MIVDRELLDRMNALAERSYDNVLYPEIIMREIGCTRDEALEILDELGEYFGWKDIAAVYMPARPQRKSQHGYPLMSFK